MSDLATMIAEIEDDLERSDTSAIRTKILGAIRFYQSERFFFNESRDVTFNTVASQQDYTFSDIGTEFYEIDGVWLTFGTSIIEVTPVDYRVIEQLREASQTEGVPTRRAYINRAMALYPTPGIVYSTRITGHLKIDAPATDGEANNEWMTEAYDLIMARAKAFLFAKRYRDIEGAAIETKAEETALAELRNKTTSKVGTGTVRSTQF